MKKIFALVLALALVLSLAACGGAEKAEEPKQEAPAVEAPAAEAPAEEAPAEEAAAGITEPVNLTLISQGPGTDDYVITAAVATVFSENLPEGSNVTQETISGGNGGAGYLIEAGMGDYSVGQNAMSATVGMEGKPPYSEISALMGMAKYPFTAVLATKSFVDKNGVSTINDVLEQKIPCRFVAEPIGSSDYVSFTYLLQVHGLTVEDIEGWGCTVTYTGGSNCVEMLQDGQADMMVGHTVKNSSSLTELCMSADMVISGLTDEEIAGMCELGYTDTVIPAGSFGVTTEDMKSACQASSKIVSSNMSNELAYTLTKILYENQERLAEDDAGFREITHANMVDTTATVVPLHPGAIQFYQEIGILDEAGNYTGK